MTRTDVVASSRPQAPSAAPKKTRVRAARGSLAALAFCVAAFVLPSAALAAEGTTGYGQTPSTPSTPPSTTPGTTPASPTTTPSTGTTPSKETTPTTGTSPSKEAEPSKETAPSKETSPSSTSAPASTSSTKSGTLPFTGFDLRWTIAMGVALMGAGFGLLALQRRQRRSRG